MVHLQSPNINLDPNVYNFTVAYNGSDIYTPASKNAKVTAQPLLNHTI